MFWGQWSRCVGAFSAHLHKKCSLTGLLKRWPKGSLQRNPWGESVNSEESWGTWGTQSVKCPTSARSDFDSQSVGLSPRVIVGLCADSSEPGACFGFCVSLSLCPSSTCTHSLSLSLSKINKHLKKIFKTKQTMKNPGSLPCV